MGPSLLPCACVRVYVTLNTLLSDAEILDAVAYARFLYTSGVDAVIVQDVGLAEILHTSLPDLPCMPRRR